MMHISRRIISFFSLLAVFVSLLAPITASAETILVWEGKERNLSILTNGRSITSGSWTNSNPSAVQIVSQGSTYCTVRGIQAGSVATITCTYKYYLAGTYFTDSESFVISVQSSSDGSISTSSSRYYVYPVSGLGNDKKGSGLVKTSNGYSYKWNMAKMGIADVTFRIFNSSGYATSNTCVWYYSSTDTDVINYSVRYPGGSVSPSEATLKTGKPGYATLTVEGITLDGYHYTPFVVTFEVYCSHVSISNSSHYKLTETICPATCVEDGIGIYTCSSCGDTKTDIIPAKGHTKVVDSAIEATCNEYGLTEGAHCSVCKSVLKEQQLVPTLPHTYRISEALQATQNRNGLRGEYKCTQCGKISEAAKTVLSSKILTLPSSLKTISSMAFSGIKAQQVVIPSGVTEIPTKAFSDCSNLVIVVLPCTVLKIADDAFDNCGRLVIIDSNPSFGVKQWCDDHSVSLFTE